MSDTDTGTADIDTSIPAEGADAATTAAPAEFDFYNDKGIHEGLQTHIGENKAAAAFFAKYQGADDPNAEVIKGIENLSYMASQKARTKPADDAPDSVKEEFQSYLRELNSTPSKAEDYGFHVRPEGLDESVPYDTEQTGKYADIIHKYNGNPEMAKELLALHHADMLTIPEQIASEQVAHQAEVMETLKNSIGVDADKTIEQAKTAANMLGASESLINYMGNDAEAIMFLSDLSKKISPDIMSNNAGANGVTAGESASNYLEKGNEASRLATEAAAKGDEVGYQKYINQQSHWNKMHANATR